MSKIVSVPNLLPMVFNLLTNRWADEVLGMGRTGSLGGRRDRAVDGAPSESVARVSKTVDLGDRTHGVRIP